MINDIILHTIFKMRRDVMYFRITAVHIVSNHSSYFNLLLFTNVSVNVLKITLQKLKKPTCMVTVSFKPT